MKAIQLIIIFFFSVFCFSQSAVDKKIERFFQVYQVNSSDAIDYLFEDNKWMENQFEEIVGLKYQLFEFQKELGEYYGYEKLYEKSLGKSIKEIVYVVKYNRMPLRFRFHFYKAKDNWTVLNFYYDGNFMDELFDTIKK
ncbi:MAG: hypothetical protein RBT46_06270 [Weeksellaceae bacterium]|jgi:hypothetical protein|nr:hypothetical protein [Weeksellaceae bacterium]MDX9705295.1 hypothetical protein [Weeksellaceae bacterium]